MPRASLFYGSRNIEVKEKSIRNLNSKELLIRVKACGICGTDIHIFNGSQGSTRVNPPVVLGHEFSGEVVQVGPEVKGFQVGDRITVDPNIYCGECFYCKNGKRHLCENLTALGVNLDGGFQEYCILPYTQAYKIPEHLSFEEGAMVEPLACCLHGIDLAEIDAGETVAIIGGGTIGLLMTQLAKLRGASFIMVSEPVEKRRNLALELGANCVINPMEQTTKEVISQKYPAGFDVVIECAGNKSAIEQALTLVKRGGTVLLFSVSDVNTQISVRPFEIFYKELTIKGSFINPHTHGRAIELIASGLVNVKPLITHCFPLESIEQAIATQTSPDAIKVLVKP
ncbi:zinc-dependent alcohol dehydrogenase family protein [Geobacillus stearothermophilus]|uniref:zinc-dependent alcohol dehydrogenase family protein n=1 Tax=Geobacillus stearothermophilus TaxID=1422 RepID=UPI003D238480